jgi:hypothetical protein
MVENGAIKEGKKETIRGQNGRTVRDAFLKALKV